MEHPVSKVAACPIFWGAHGGQFTDLGGLDPESEDARLLCGKAFDCFHCSFMHEWLAEQERKGFSISWECSACIKFSKKLDAKAGIQRVIPGFYQAGRKRNQDPLQDDPDEPGLEGCLHVLEADNPETGQVAGQVCGWESSFLQLVLRRRDVRSVPAST